MSSGWAFRSFDRVRWDATFGSGAPWVEQKIVDAMLGWEDGYFDPDSDDLLPGFDRDNILSSAKGKVARALASHLTNKGFTYEGLGEAMSVQLDDFGGSGSCGGQRAWQKRWMPSCFHRVGYRPGRSRNFCSVLVGSRPCNIREASPPSQAAQQKRQCMPLGWRKGAKCSAPHPCPTHLCASCSCWIGVWLVSAPRT